MTAPSVISGMLTQIGGSLLFGRGANTVAVWFALVLGLALGLAIASLLCAIYLGRQNRRLQRVLRDPPVYGARRRTRLPATWAGHRQWLAIRDSHPHRVQAALRLHNPTPCSWEEGLTAAHEQMLFISPPVAGWTLVMGASLPEPAEDVEACFHFLRELSDKLGLVQFFSYNRAQLHHAWVEAEGGVVRRAYAWAGRTLWNQGELTPAERELGLTCYDYNQRPAVAGWGQSHPLAVNTERVAMLAARWSVNPAAIDLRFVRDGHGITGRLSSPQAQ